MPEDQKRLFMAVAISIIVIVGTNTIFGTNKPKNTNLDEAPVVGTLQDAKIGFAPDETNIETASEASISDISADMPDADSDVYKSRQEILGEDDRITIASDKLHGSIRKKGARIDDLIMMKYRETIEKDSAPISLLSPAKTKKPYYAEFGWTRSSNSNVKLPDSNSLWKASQNKLTPTSPVTLSWDNGEGLVFQKTVKIDENYLFSVTQKVINNTDKPVRLYPYGLISRTGRPEKAARGVIHEGVLGVFDGTLEEMKYADLEKAESQKFTTKGGWLGITDKYWLTALAFDQTISNVQGRFNYKKIGSNELFQSDFLAPPMTINANSSSKTTSLFFAGAKEIRLLDKYRDELGIEKFDLAIDFGWYYFLTKPFFYLLEFFYKVVGNMGFAILLFAALLRLAMYPIANKSYTNMSKMKKLQPKVTRLQEKYAHDKVKLNQEMMELYKKEKVNPAAGCLPMLIQIPVFFSLYKVLYISIEIRHAPFIGWIKDLSAPDPTSVFTLFGLIPWDVPSMINIGFWPLVMGITMYLQQKLNPKPADKTQAKVFGFMPVIFTFMLGRFASGLVIYWAWSNLLSIIQQKAIMKKMGVK
jgi:YidC/Oxa1 family membrane protein insertase